MWQRIRHRLSDPVTYRKHGLNLLRRLRPPRPPRPISLDRLIDSLDGRPVLGIFAHPDDELFASGLLAELSLRRIPFHLACLTRGEGGPLGEFSRAELGQVRERELRVSASALGAESIRFLGHIDPVGNPFRVYAPKVSVSHLTSQILDVMEEHRPALMITHGSGGEYWHPAHLLTHRAVREAANSEVTVLTIHAWRPDHPLPQMLNRDDPADLIVDGRPHQDRRLAALKAHQSQSDYFSSLGSGSLEIFLDRTAWESYRVYPAARVSSPDRQPPLSSRQTASRD